jgi:hypothetical protein
MGNKSLGATFLMACLLPSSFNALAEEPLDLGNGISAARTSPFRIEVVDKSGDVKFLGRTAITGKFTAFHDNESVPEKPVVALVFFPDKKSRLNLPVHSMTPTNRVHIKNANEALRMLMPLLADALFRGDIKEINGVASIRIAHYQIGPGCAHVSYHAKFERLVHLGTRVDVSSKLSYDPVC